MHRHAVFAFVVLASAATMAMAIGANLDSPRSFMTWQDHEASRQVLEAQARLELAGCRGLDNGAKIICRVRTRAHDRVRRAELEARYLGTVTSESLVGVANAKGTFEIARAHCQAHSDDDQAACLGKARAAQARAGTALPST